MAITLLIINLFLPCSLFAMDVDQTLSAESDDGQALLAGLERELELSDQNNRMVAADNLKIGRAFLYYKEEFLDYDYDMAHKYLICAADQEFDLRVRAWACVYLAQMYYFGMGVSADPQRVAAFIRQARRCQGAIRRLYPEQENEISRICDILENPRKVHEIIDNLRDTPIFRAISKGHVELVKLLIQLGADVNHRNINGNTPLNVAVIVERKNVVRILLSANACPTAKNNKGTTVIALAANKPEIKRLIFKGIVKQFMQREGADTETRAIAHLHMDDNAGRNNAEPTEGFTDYLISKIFSCCRWLKYKRD